LFSEGVNIIVYTSRVNVTKKRKALEEDSDIDHKKEKGAL